MSENKETTGFFIIERGRDSTKTKSDELKAKS
jgi:hypothetical protein